MRRLFRRYRELTVAQRRLYSFLIVITAFTALLYCLGVSSLLLRSQLVREVAVESLPTFTPSFTPTPTTVLLPGQTPTPTATLPPTPTQRPIPTYTPTPTPTSTPETITMTVVITATPGVTTTIVISATVTPTPVLTPTATITAETSLAPPLAVGPTSPSLATSKAYASRGIGCCNQRPPYGYVSSFSESPLGNFYPAMRSFSPPAALPVAMLSPRSMSPECLKGRGG
jgi:hypothetical protein